MTLTTITRRLALVCALALAALGAGAPAASAGESESIRVDGGNLIFYDLGETLRLKDTRRDGYGLRAYLIWGGLPSEELTDFNGAHNRPEYKDLSIPENNPVTLKLCYTNNGANVGCSKPQQGVS